MGKLFGTDGIRGVAGRELDCELSLGVGRALGSVIERHGSSPTVIIGTDTRISSEMIAAAVAAGLSSVGCDVIDIGVCPTPAVAFLVKRRGAAAGVMISASHNPYEYNGIKIFGQDGYKLPDDTEEKIENIIFNGQKPALPDNIGRIKKDGGAIEEYLDYLAAAFPVSLSGMKIAVDCACGSASVTAGELFSRLGADCHMIGNSPNGVNINKECGSTSLSALKDAVLKEGCDVGIAFDGDADRCIALDHLGREVDGDYIMAILALKLKGEGALAESALVGTVMTNLGLRKFCEENGISFAASAVGDRYVLELMKKNGYSFGGEQSGHIIFGDIATTGDGQLTALALLSHIKKSGKSLSTLATVMKKYPQYTVNIAASKEHKALLGVSSKIKEIIALAEERLGKTGRILVRASGTEALIRIMVESADASLAKEIAENTAREISEIFS